MKQNVRNNLFPLALVIASAILVIGWKRQQPWEVALFVGLVVAFYVFAWIKS